MTSGRPLSAECRAASPFSPERDVSAVEETRIGWGKRLTGEPAKGEEARRERVLFELELCLAMSYGDS